MMWRGVFLSHAQHPRGRAMVGMKRRLSGGSGLGFQITRPVPYGTPKRGYWATSRVRGLPQ